jgi:lysylphosphatidylglycerol synthetase-like protein (DUF2156 family)
MNNGAPRLFKAQWIVSMDEGFWFGCLMLFLLVLVVLTLLSGWLVARLVMDGLLLVLLVDGRLAVAVDEVGLLSWCACWQVLMAGGGGG